ncbi:MAG: phage tail protein [Chitinophagaceae bacterium]
MAGEAQDKNWPLPKFYFSVDWGSQQNLQFHEVSGLDMESQALEYRHGNSKVFAPIKMPGMQKVSNVTMKKGVFKGDNTFFDWFNKIKMNTIERQAVTIKLLDEGGNPTMVWTLNNAFPVKITSTDMKADGNEVAIESLEIAFETMTIANS